MLKCIVCTSASSFRSSENVLSGRIRCMMRENWSKQKKKSIYEVNNPALSHQELDTNADERHEGAELSNAAAEKEEWV